MLNIPNGQCDCGGAFEYHSESDTAEVSGEDAAICRYSKTCGCEGYEEDMGDYRYPYTPELAQSHRDQHEDGTPDVVPGRGAAWMGHFEGLEVAGYIQNLESLIDGDRTSDLGQLLAPVSDYLAKKRLQTSI
tara:strand:- start:96 stop:491 length:396 start_codon:yes stop_codon:yes gene_type:complete